MRASQPEVAGQRRLPSTFCELGAVLFSNGEPAVDPAGGFTILRNRDLVGGQH